MERKQALRTEAIGSDAWSGTAVDGRAMVRVSAVGGLTRITVWSDGKEIVRQLTYRTAFEMGLALLRLCEEQTETGPAMSLDNPDGSKA